MTVSEQISTLFISLSRLDEGSDRYEVELRFHSPLETEELTPCRGVATFSPQTLDDLHRARLGLQVSKPEDYAKVLHQALFADARLVDYFERWQQRAGGAGGGLRLRLIIDQSAALLNDLCFEALSTLDGKGFLSLAAEQPFSRFLTSSDWSRYAPRPRGSLLALVFVANPSGLPQNAPITGADHVMATMDVKGELERAREGLKKLGSRVVELSDVPGGQCQATFQNLTAYLLQGFDIVYLVCHGAMISPGAGQAPQPYLVFENKDGAFDVIKAQQLIDFIANLPAAARPRLVVLGSCQSAGVGMVPGGPPNEPQRSYDQGSLSALGPLLVQKAGIPAVIAMQGNILMDTVKQLMPAFFDELLKDGSEGGMVDRAMAAARNLIFTNKCPDWWSPVLYLRLTGGRLWYEKGFQVSKDDSFGLWKGIINSIYEKQCVPILGPGLLEKLLGSPAEVARRLISPGNLEQEWTVVRQVAQFFQASPEDMSLVTQYLVTSQGGVANLPRSKFIQLLQTVFQNQYDKVLPGDVLQRRSVEEMLANLSPFLRKSDPDNPFEILSRLPFDLYINASPDNLLQKSLEHRNRKPLLEHFRWNLDQDNKKSTYSRNQPPSLEQPLLYHMYGRINDVSSLVLTEDDYFDFLARVNQVKKLPLPVSNAFTNKALLFLGFHTSDWNFRMLFHSILNEERRNIRKLNEGYLSVAVQVDPCDGYAQPERMRAYLDRYFARMHFAVYWGSADLFLKELWQAWVETYPSYCSDHEDWCDET